jgi:hypothetical protein
LALEFYLVQAPASGMGLAFEKQSHRRKELQMAIQWKIWEVQDSPD